MNNYEKIKELYDKGFKCIRYEDNIDNSCTVFLKNFEEEKIDKVVSNNKNEINKIKGFINTK